MVGTHTLVDAVVSLALNTIAGLGVLAELALGSVCDLVHESRHVV